MTPSCSLDLDVTMVPGCSHASKISMALVVAQSLDMSMVTGGSPDSEYTVAFGGNRSHECQQRSCYSRIRDADMALAVA